MLLEIGDDPFGEQIGILVSIDLPAAEDQEILFTGDEGAESVRFVKESADGDTHKLPLQLVNFCCHISAARAIMSSRMYPFNLHAKGGRLIFSILLQTRRLSSLIFSTIA